MNGRLIFLLCDNASNDSKVNLFLLTYLETLIPKLLAGNNSIKSKFCMTKKEKKNMDQKAFFR